MRIKARTILIILPILIICLVSHGCKPRPKHSIEDLPNLIAMLEDPDRLVRIQAATGIAELGSDAEEAIPNLILALDDPEWGVRAISVYALRRIGKSSMAALPKVLENIENMKDDLRPMVEFVREFHPPSEDVMPFLIGALRTDDNNALAMVIVTIGEYADEGKEALPKLEEIYNSNSNQEIHYQAGKVIKRINR